MPLYLNNPVHRSAGKPNSQYPEGLFNALNGNTGIIASNQYIVKTCDGNTNDRKKENHQYSIRTGGHEIDIYLLKSPDGKPQYIL
jgi:hypothetical protein